MLHTVQQNKAILMFILLGSQCSLYTYFCIAHIQILFCLLEIVYLKDTIISNNLI